MPTLQSIPLAPLRQLLAQPARATDAQCELCGGSLTERHRHLVDPHARRLVCACAACIATRQSATPDRTDLGALRPLPSRYVHRPAMTISPQHWDTLEIPVDLAFVFVNSAAGRPVACYPGPTGAVESALTLDAWRPLVDSYPWIGSLAPDVEAVLVRRVDGAYRCFIVPIDRCYELAGRIRGAWTGLGGGDAVRTVVGRFFDEIIALSGEP
jgi:hypothetical protein